MKDVVLFAASFYLLKQDVMRVIDSGAVHAGNQQAAEIGYSGPAGGSGVAARH
jgi:hypothetical protein